MKKTLWTLLLVTAIICLCAVANGGVLTLGTPVELNSPTDGTIEAACFNDSTVLTGAYTSIGTITRDLNIPAKRLQYHFFNSMTPNTGIRGWTIFYDSSLASKIIGAEAPNGYMDIAGAYTSLGGSPHAILFNNGYGWYDYNPGAPWLIYYGEDCVSFLQRSGVHALPHHMIVGNIHAGFVPPFAICVDPTTNLGPVTAAAGPETESSLFWGTVVGPVTAPAPSLRIDQAKELADFQPVKLSGKIISGKFPEKGYFYIQEPDRFAGIRVRSNDLPSSYPGNVTVFGYLDTRWAEREILPINIIPSTGIPELKPLGMTNKQVGGGISGLQVAVPSTGIGLNNVGLLVRTTGRVKEHITNCFFIDDGSPLFNAIDTTLAVSSPHYFDPKPPINSYVAVTGISGAETLSGFPVRMVRTRETGDISILQMPVAFVYGPDYGSAKDFKILLDANHFNTDLIHIDQAATTDFSKYSIVIVGDDTGYMSNWGTAAAIETLRDCNRPIMGIGEGGYALLGKLSLQTGYPHGAHRSLSTMIVSDPLSSIYTTPYTITIPGHRTLSLFTTPSADIEIFLLTIPSDIEVIGETGVPSYYTVTREKNRYTLWGYSDPPGNMTTTGQQMFVNTVLYAAR